MKSKILEADITGESLTHTTHTEDLLIDGSKAARFALAALYSVFDMLKGSTPSSKLNIKGKWDGAPSAAAATNFHGQRFVATKGFFAKNRKIAYTEEDCDRYFGHAPDLAKKMKALLNHLDEINIPENQIWQGDFLFDRDTLKTETIDGEKCVTFHPNTIVYAVPLADPLSQQMLKADIGIVWHTRYRGADFDSLKISFDANVAELSKTPNVFNMDARLPSIAGIVTLTEEETTKTEKLLDQASSLTEELIADGVLDVIAQDEELKLFINTFENYIIKTQAKQFDSSPARYIQELRDWVAARFDKELASKKQPKTRQAYQAKKDEALAKIDTYRNDLIKLISVQQIIVALKEFFIKKLNRAGSFKTLLKTIDKGYIPTGHEGYAISDIDGNIQKFVSRLEFSYSNFSKDIVKGWMSDARMRESRKREKMTVPELKTKIITNVERTEDPATLVRTYNALTSFSVDVLLDLIKPRFDVDETRRRIAGILYRDRPESVENDDYLTILKTFISNSLIPIPPDGVAINYRQIAIKRASQLAIKFGLDEESAMLVADSLIDRLVDETFLQNGVSVGKGEVLFALLMKDACKRGEGDLTIDNSHVEVKGVGAYLMGSGAKGGLLVKPSVIGNNIRNYIKTNFGENFPSFSESTSLNIYAAGPPLLVEVLETLTARDTSQEKLSQFATYVVNQMCSMVASPTRAAILKKQLISSFLAEDWLNFRNTMLTYHYDAYSERAGWEKLLLFNNKTNLVTVISSSKAFIDAVMHGVIYVKPLSLTAGNRDVGAERGGGFMFELQPSGSPYEEAEPAYIKSVRKKARDKERWLQTLERLQIDLRDKETALAQQKLSPSRRANLEKSIQLIKNKISNLNIMLGRV